VRGLLYVSGSRGSGRNGGTLPTICFTCRDKSAGNDYAGPYSAYCGDCQPKASGPSPHGKECLCAVCGELFTSPSAFDLHQTAGSCLPMNATRQNGVPMFAPVRERDGFQVWGSFRPDLPGRHDISNLSDFQGVPA
jgi:hypothetical protein